MAIRNHDRSTLNIVPDECVCVSGVQGVGLEAGAEAYDQRKGTALPADAVVRCCGETGLSSEALRKCLRVQEPSERH